MMERVFAERFIAEQQRVNAARELLKLNSRLERRVLGLRLMRAEEIARKRVPTVKEQP